MATPVDPDFRARLAALNDKFAATVPGTLDKIRAALAACVAENVAAGAAPSQDALHQLHEVLHGVAGSAGTFGFAVFGQEARRIEQMVRAVLGSGEGWAPVAPEVEKLLAWAARDAKASQYD
ncbi:Hpt domain-containing protein [Pseudoduganella sp. FT25W]|jgi:chemotaxis protein histidine kinase CheA|uniref:Hpt domain-containing protein n=1 Tax=Duganella alba TaxID=2666081 RepID=A0A6L5QJH0_9BURK|nr:Hpt domain-containing protein [Duganella alba]MRX09933.1 Hpt domain-containing protein [Duganella alba]MRX17570.1 Hpt domain-containing protein [Duganella alba]